jgi:purine-binding chemotaxis protein CheW
MSSEGSAFYMTIDTTLKDTDSKEIQLVVFTLGQESYGVDIGAISTIIRPQTITYVPHTPPHVQGVMNLRGVIIPVVDLRCRLGFDPIEITPTSRIIVVELGKMQVGMMVDAVTETLSMPLSDIDPLPEMVVSVDSAYLQGVGKVDDRLIILLDLGQVLKPGEVRNLDAILSQE